MKTNTKVLCPEKKKMQLNALATEHFQKSVLYLDKGLDNDSAGTKPSLKTCLLFAGERVGEQRSPAQVGTDVGHRRPVGGLLDTGRGATRTGRQQWLHQRRQSRQQRDSPQQRRHQQGSDVRAVPPSVQQMAYC